MMTEEEIPDYHIFMMCEQLNENARTALSPDYYFRNCQPSELEMWKALPFDSDTVPSAYQNDMDDFVKNTYGRDMQTFLKNTLFVCNQKDQPIATCSYWKAYGKFNTIHWFKTIKAYEGKGVGRALLSETMSRFDRKDYPIYIHTQPGSFRAIKLYTDFGFKLLKGGKLGTRVNELEKSLPILKKFMTPSSFEKLEVMDTPDCFIKQLENETTIQF